MSESNRTHSAPAVNPNWPPDLFDVVFIRLTKGKFACVNQSDWSLVGDGLWFANRGNSRNLTLYARGRIGPDRRRKRDMHRVILSAQPGQRVDHENGNGLDNRRCNLRFATCQQNAVNRKAARGSTSRFKGVSWSRKEGRWRVSISFNYRDIWIGYFDDEEKAARAYDAVAIRLYGEFANPNFPP